MIDAESGRIYRQIGYLNRSTGYYRVNIDGEERALHRVIWESVHGPIPDEMVINHLNADTTDNRISNLECVTRGGNNAYTYRIGRRPRGQPPQLAIRHSRLSAADIARLKAAPRGSITALAKELGVARSYAYQIRSGRRIYAETVLASGGP